MPPSGRAVSVSTANTTLAPNSEKITARVNREGCTVIRRQIANARTPVPSQASNKRIATILIRSSSVAIREKQFVGRYAIRAQPGLLVATEPPGQLGPDAEVRAAVSQAYEGVRGQRETARELDLDDADQLERVGVSPDE